MHAHVPVLPRGRHSQFRLSTPRKRFGILMYLGSTGVHINKTCKLVGPGLCCNSSESKCPHMKGEVV